MVIGIRVELSLKFSERLGWGRVAGRVGIGLRPVEAVDAGVSRFQRPEHVIEGAVLHHQHDEVFQFVESRRHAREISSKQRDTVQLHTNGVHLAAR
jgi:hypothetical protein